MTNRNSKKIFFFYDSKCVMTEVMTHINFHYELTMQLTGKCSQF